MIIPSQQLIHTHHHPPSCRQKPRVTVPSCKASLSHTLCIVSQSLDAIADIQNQTGNISQGRLLIVDSHIWKANDSEELIGGNPRWRLKTFPIGFSLIMAPPFKPWRQVCKGKDDPKELEHNKRTPSPTIAAGKTDSELYGYTLLQWATALSFCFRCIWWSLSANCAQVNGLHTVSCLLFNSCIWMWACLCYVNALIWKWRLLFFSESSESQMATKPCRNCKKTHCRSKNLSNCFDFSFM